MIGMRPPQTAQAQEKLRRNPSGSEPARTKSKPQRSTKVRGAVQSQIGTAELSVESAVESSISRSASESDEEEEEDEEDLEDEECRDPHRSDTTVESDEDEDDEYSRRQRANTTVDSHEEEDDSEYSPRNREDTIMVESNEDEDEVYIRGRQGADTMEITGDPVWGMLEKSRDFEASASAKQLRGKAFRANASARQRGKASGVSTSASQTVRGSDPEYTCLGLDILCEIFSDDDEEDVSADENDE